MPTYPLINCAIDFAIDGVQMAHQPFIVQLDGAEAEMVETARGYVLPAVRLGRHVRITWGEGVATEAAVAEIRAALGTTLEHTFTWTDPDLTAQSINVGIEGYETQWSWEKPGYYEPVVVEAWERAPARAGGTARQVFWRGFVSFSPSSTAVRYAAPDRTLGWNATQNLREIIVPAGGRLSHLALFLGTAPGLTRSWAFEMLINGAPSGLIVTISGTSTTGENSVNTPTVAAGDRITLRSTPTNTPAAPGELHFTWQFTPIVATTSIAPNLSAQADTNVSQRFIALGTPSGSPQSTIARTSSVWAVGGVLDAFYMSLNNAPGLGRSWQFDLFRNGLAVGTTLTISGLSTTGSLTGLGLTVTPGDLWAVRITPVGLPAVGGMAYGVAYTPTTPGQWNAGAFPNTFMQALPPGSTPGWVFDNLTGSADWNSEDQKLERILIAAGGAVPRVHGLRLQCDTAPGVGFAPEIILRVNEADAATSATYEETATTAVSTTPTVLANGDQTAMRIAGEIGALEGVRWAWVMSAN